MLERIGYKVEILVVYALRRTAETDCRVSGCHFRRSAQLNTSETCEVGTETVCVHHMRKRVGLSFLCNKGRFGRSLCGNGAHTLRKPRRIAHGYQRVLRHIAEQ